MAEGPAARRLELDLDPHLTSARTAAAAAEKLVVASTRNAHEGQLVALLVVEAITNVVRHGWRGAARDRIHLGLAVGGWMAEIHLRYPGAPFDWRAPELPPDASELREGGYGLVLIHSLADHISPRSDGTVQELTLIRRMDRPAPAAPAAMPHEVLPMHCSIQRHGDSIVVTPEVPIIDAEVAVPFKEQLHAHLGQLERDGVSAPCVILDLHGVNFMDSSGLGAIISVRKTLGARGELRLAGVQPEVRALFELTRLVRVLPLFDDVQQALAARAAASR